MLRSLLFACCAVLSCSAIAADAMPDSQHGFDSSFGIWQVHIKRLNPTSSDPHHWSQYDGTHTITPIWEGRGSVGVLKASGPEGQLEAVSPRLYNPATRQWTIRYASARDGEMGDPLVGHFEGERGIFYGKQKENGKVVMVRDIYATIDADHHRMEMATSSDGGKHWETNWIMDELRSPGAALADPIAAAIADPSRPQADRNRDGERKPADVLRFAGVKAGDHIADFNAGSGYFARLFGDLVGERGHVYAIEPAEIQKYIAGSTAEMREYAASHPNVSVVVDTALGSLHLPAKLDLFWISQNYHDLHGKLYGPADIAAFNKAVFDALKPGGAYIVLDHAAVAGAPIDVVNSLHRIDPAIVRREVEAAGFVFDGDSAVLANPADPRTIEVFDKSVRGRTDQFILKFRKPQ